MFDKLKNFYVDCLYKASMIGTKQLEALMLHVINVQGLDPNCDPEKLKRERFQEELNMALAPGGTHTKTLRVPVKNFKRPVLTTAPNAYVNKVVVPPGSVPDFSDAGKINSDVAYVTKKVPPPPSDDLVTACDNFAAITEAFANLSDTAEDRDLIKKVTDFGNQLDQIPGKLGPGRFFNSDDVIKKEFTSPSTSAEQIKELAEAIKKKSKTAKKTSKKAAKKSTKKPTKTTKKAAKK